MAATALAYGATEYTTATAAVWVEAFTNDYPKWLSVSLSTDSAEAAADGVAMALPATSQPSGLHGVHVAGAAVAATSTNAPCNAVIRLAPGESIWVRAPGVQVPKWRAVTSPLFDPR